MRTSLLQLSVLSTVVCCASSLSPKRVAPWCMVRGGDEGSPSAASIPAGGSDGSNYASRLEAVKSQVLVAATESVSFCLIIFSAL